MTSRKSTAEPVEDGTVDEGAPWTRGLHGDTGYLLYRLGLRSGQLFNAVLQRSGLRLRHYALLRHLATVEGAAQRELSQELGHDPSAIVGLVDDLERLGFVERRPAPDDRRRRIVVLAPAGHDFLRASHEAARGVTDELLSALGPEERETLHGLLSRMAHTGDGPSPATRGARYGGSVR
ncbi:MULTISPECIES: MarR family winged helix-turn-helix transcriptional regulator [unclassified Streptomyces]|uniref:MarR family winged helix-turn-helix transcriptional regulator n=1 Tax=unclassified Streptomyces TaxID=2593676 RepID=UPI0033E9D338